MMHPSDIAAREAEIRALLRERLGVEAGSLEKALRKAGRRVPKHLQEEARVLIDAVAKVGHPKLARTLDARAVERAHARLVAHLERIDPAERRKDAILGTLGVVVFNLLVVFVLLLVVLRWRGFI